MLDNLQKLEWTGERYLPWISNATLGYEHLHRYAFAARYARDKRVLDLGSGEGYGANILARTASSVLGVDIDHEAIQHATAKYRRDNLRFDTGSFAHVPIRENHTFDLVVCFEAIEHIWNHDELLGEVKRLLKPDGLFMVSTPNKTEYQKVSPERNPYHIKELEPEEFQHLLSRYFQKSSFLGQRIHPCSSIWPMGSCNASPIEELRVERNAEEFEFIGNENLTPIYFIVLASDSPEALVPEGSVLLDKSNELLNEKDAAIKAVNDLRSDLAWHIQRLGEVQESVTILISDLHNTQIEVRNNTAELRVIYTSRSWKLLNKCWQIRDVLFPRQSIRRRVLQQALRFITPESE